MEEGNKEKNDGKYTCQLWPDVKPKVDHTGLKQGRLKYLYPVGITYFHNRNKEWLWLCECECGKERMIRAKGNYISCGECRVYKKKRKPVVERVKTRPSGVKLPPMVKFNRGIICIKNHNPCAHYHTCQDERLETNKVSTRYIKGGGCFTVRP